MGIKTIHIVLISCAVLVAGFFGYWALNNGRQPLGLAAFVTALALAVYGFFFLQKARKL